VSAAGLLFLIPLLPFLGFLANGLLSRRLPRAAVSAIGCTAAAAAFLVAAAATIELLGKGSTEPALSNHLWRWIAAGSLEVPFRFRIDRLSAVMALVVTGVGSLIHFYSTGYMRGDPGYARYFAYLNLFLAAMLVLVLADNIVLLFLGWEGVGLASYLLIGFWYKELPNCAAGTKAFIANRIGDLGFLLGIFLIFIHFGTFDLAGINAGVAGKSESALFWIALLLFAGATGKSAQIPLYVWLPDAMAGPTPVSALIHAATMVTSGVYMVARLGALYSAVPEVSAVVAAIGALTALLGAAIALSQTDIKKVLAYSTVSQLGYMFLAAGAGAYGVAVFHLVTHAFFKALLFLAAGAVIHSLHHEQDMRRMGGLAKKLPQTFALFTIGALALSGFPLTAGFFSKDEILHAVHARAGGEASHLGWTALWGIGLLTAVMTAFYSFRQVVLVFLGAYRGAAGEPQHGAAHGSDHGPARSLDELHEAPLSMRLPLFVLAALSLAGGFLAVPHFVFPDAHAAEDGKLAGWILGGLLAITGITAAFFLYVLAPALVQRFTRENRAGRFLLELSYRKFYVDEIYDLLVVRPLVVLSHVLFYLVDRALIDWLLVGGAGFAARTAGHILRRLQTGRAPTYAAWFLGGAIGALALALWAAGGGTQ
jgi:NADH-quinone oxidoreductase subunit L